DLAPETKVEGPIEQALRVTDLPLLSGGFGLVAIDLSDVPLKMARRIPLTSWFRFQRAVENTPTVLFVIGQVPCAQTCATLLLKLQASEKSVVGPWSSVLGERPTTNDVRRIIPPHAQLLDGLQVEGELLRCRMERKPSRSVNAAFMTKMPRAGCWVLIRKSAIGNRKFSIMPFACIFVSDFPVEALLRSEPVLR